MVQHPAHHLEVCILAPTVAGVPRRRHPNVVKNNLQFTPRPKDIELVEGGVLEQILVDG